MFFGSAAGFAGVREVRCGFGFRGWGGHSVQGSSFPFCVKTHRWGCNDAGSGRGALVIAEEHERRSGVSDEVEGALSKSKNEIPAHRGGRSRGPSASLHTPANGHWRDCPRSRRELMLVLDTELLKSSCGPWGNNITCVFLGSRRLALRWLVARQAHRRSHHHTCRLSPIRAISPLERVSNHLVSHCREIVLFRQARNPGKLPNTVHCNHCTVRPGSGSAAQVARRQNPKRGLRRSCPD